MLEQPPKELLIYEPKRIKNLICVHGDIMAWNVSHLVKFKHSVAPPTLKCTTGCNLLPRCLLTYCCILLANVNLNS